MATLTDDTTAPEPALAELVRTATAEAHRRAEEAPFVADLVEGHLPIDAYIDLAVQHHAIYEALEETVEANRDPVIAPFLDPALARLPSLEDDLVFLAGSRWREVAEVRAATASYAARIRHRGGKTSAALLAHHYLRYLGDLSGGQVIGRVLQRTYGFPDGRGTSFYRFERIPSPKAFKDRYRAGLDALPWTGGERREFVDEVTAGFGAHGAMFEALGSG